MYQPITPLLEEPDFMFKLAESLVLIEIPEINPLQPSLSEEVTYPDRHVQAGTFFGNINLDDETLYMSIRNTL